MRLLKTDAAAIAILILAFSTGGLIRCLLFAQYIEQNANAGNMYRAGYFVMPVYFFWGGS